MSVMGSCQGRKRESRKVRKSFEGKEIGTDSQSLSVPIINGGGGIRTPGTSLHNGFQDRHHKPLGHSSSSLLTRLYALCQSSENAICAEKCAVGFPVQLDKFDFIPTSKNFVNSSIVLRNSSSI